jgi:hypothetical protein
MVAFVSFSSKTGSLVEGLVKRQEGDEEKGRKLKSAVLPGDKSLHQ